MVCTGVYTASPTCTPPQPRFAGQSSAAFLRGIWNLCMWCVTLDEIFVLTVHSTESALYANPTLRTVFCFLGCLLFTGEKQRGEQQLCFVFHGHTHSMRKGTVPGQQGALHPPQSLSSRLTLGLLHTGFPLVIFFQLTVLIFVVSLSLFLGFSD